MNYKDTILKQKEFNWTNPKINISKDGKVDFDIHIPLTDILDKQAQRSFTFGVIELMKFAAKLQQKEQLITPSLLRSKFIEWGLPPYIIDKFPQD